MTAPVTFSEQVQGKLVRQIEFYFSDSNLPQDRFLKGKIAEDPERYVQLRIIIAFARMRELLKIEATQPKDVPEAVVTAVAAVLRARSTALEVDATGQKLRRAQPLGDEAKLSEEIDARSLYVCPFPHNALMDQLTEYFAQHGQVNAVRLRRHPGSKTFKGSVFVEWASEEEARRVLGLSLTFAGAPLRMELKKDYLARKPAQGTKAATAGTKEDGGVSNDELSDGVGGTVRGPVVVDAPTAAQAGQKRKREEGDADGEEAEAAGPGDAGTHGEEGPDDAEAADADGGPASTGFKFHEGLLLGFTLVEPLPPEVTASTLVKQFGGRPSVKFVEINEDRRGGYVRFAAADQVAAAILQWEEKPKDTWRVGGAQASSVRAVTGGEEAEYAKRAEAAWARKASSQGRGRGGGRGGGGGRGRGGRGGRR